MIMRTSDVAGAAKADATSIEREPRRIVVGVDDGPVAQLAIRWAVEEARIGSRSLVVVHVPSHDVSPGMPMSAENFSGNAAAAVSETRGYGDAMAYARDRLPEGTLIGIQLPGRPSKMLLNEAEGGGLIVVGTRGRGRVQSVALGSVSSTVAAQATGPVAVIHALHDEEAQRGYVVVGVDGSAHSDRALELAFEEASLRQAELTIVHCGRHDRAVDGARDRHTKIGPEEQPRVRARTVCIDSDPVDALTGYSHTAELVVVGSRGYSCLAGSLLGSVSQDVLRHARCPVVVVH